MSEVQILSPRPKSAARVTARAEWRKHDDGAGTHLPAVKDGDASGAGADPQMAARIRAGDAARPRSADGLGERARYAQRGKDAVPDARRGCRLRREAWVAIHCHRTAR